MLLLLLNALGITEVQAAAWTQPEGVAYTKIWDHSIFGTRAILEDGSIVELPGQFQDHGLGIYGELGLADDWTAVLSSTPVAWSSFDGESAVYSGTSLLGIRRAITTGGLRTAIELRGGGTPEAPLLASGVVEGRDWTWRPATGGLRGDAELQMGTGFRKMWTVLSVGGTGFLGNELEPVLVANAQLGGHATKKLTIASTFAAWLPAGPIETIEVSGRGKTRYVGFNLDVAYATTEHLSLVAGLGGGLFVQANAAVPSLGLGVSWQGPFWKTSPSSASAATAPR